MRKQLVILFFLSFLLQGCVQTLAVRSMSGIMEYGFQAFNEESDIQIARESLGGNLKLLEALVKADPDNEQLLLFEAEGYNAYALAFAEDDSADRARVFYLRGKDFGMRILSHDDKFVSSLDKDEESFREAVRGLSKKDVPAVFWTAINWGSYINLTRTSMAALADLPRVNVMMEFVRAHDSTYYYGGADLFLGAMEGSMPPGLGGRPEKAKAFFERALAINKGRFLMTYVFYAKTYAVQTQDQPLFESLLQKVDTTSLEILPEARLANAVAKQKAKLLRSRENDLF
jgi:hypothetical protein